MVWSLLKRIVHWSYRSLSLNHNKTLPSRSEEFGLSPGLFYMRSLSEGEVGWVMWESRHHRLLWGPQRQRAALLLCLRSCSPVFLSCSLINIIFSVQSEFNPSLHVPLVMWEGLRWYPRPLRSSPVSRVLGSNGPLQPSLNIDTPSPGDLHNTNTRYCTEIKISFHNEEVNKLSVVGNKWMKCIFWVS